MRLLLTILATLIPLPLSAEPARPAWDQAAALKRVQSVLALEATGQPWDKIAWETAPDTAADRAERENKPIFLYFYLKTEVGPAAAPG